MWVKFLKTRLMPTTHTTTISQERLVLLYVNVRGLRIDVRSIIEKEIRDCAVKSHKAATLLFPSLITSICVVSGVRLGAKDEHVKEWWCPYYTHHRENCWWSCWRPIRTSCCNRSEMSYWVRTENEVLSTNIIQCAEAQQRENNRSWSYL